MNGRVRLITTLMMLILYVACYASSVSVGDSTITDDMLLRPTPEYSIGGDVASIVFRPVHEIDRRIRTETWQDIRPACIW